MSLPSNRCWFTLVSSGVFNLAREGVSEDRVFLVGNVMIDTLLKNPRQGHPPAH